MRALPRATWPLLILLVGLLAGWAHREALGQDLALAGQRPRFLYTPSPGVAPVEIPANRSAMLRRLVSLNLDRPTAGRLLEVIERQTGLKFLYSPDRLPADRAVPLRAESITVAAALTEILLDSGLDVVLSKGNQVAFVEVKSGLSSVQGGAIAGRVTDAKTKTALSGATVIVLGTNRSATTGSDGRYRIADVAPGTYTVRARYIGYTPGTASVTVSADREATADFSLEKSAQRLDEVVTTGTVVPTEVKALPTPISVVTAEDIQRQNLQRVDQIFRGQVPGAIAWDQGPGYDYLSSIAVRGGSTLSTTQNVKTFIDGVEVANSNYIATIDPNSIDRIEITRGPQASTLYGAGALDGVMQIFTKKGQLGLKQPEVAAKVSAGGVGGYSSSSALQTDNTVSVLGGGEKTSYNVGGSYRHTGEWVPSYHSTDWGVSAGGQVTQGPLKLSTSLRYANQTFDPPWNTRFQAYTPFSQPYYETYHLRQQTYGLTATAQATANWQHTLTLGYDQNYLAIDQTRPRFTAPADSFLFASASHEAKTSLLYHTDLRLRLGPALAAIVTAGINRDTYDYASSSASGATHTTGFLDGPTSLALSSWTNTGYFSQVQLNLAERLFVTGGVRAERNPNFGVGFGTAWSPRIGAAYVLGLGRATVKLRASYGESIRAPAPGERDGSVNPTSILLANPALAPERQRGADGGVDIYFGRASLGVTYYNQRAVDLIDLVTLPDTLPTYQYQNVSRVKNDGWEFEGRLPVGRLELAGTYSITNSTVQGLPPDYTGDYQIGDHILGIPLRSAGATVTYSPFPRTMLSASMTHIGHWINPDYVSFFASVFGGAPYRGSTRAYWLEYPTVTKFALGVSQVLRNGLTAFVRAENVGNNLRPEVFNLNLPTPRSVVVGANLRY